MNYVSNFTDVDDKIIKKANEEGVDASVISERFNQGSSERHGRYERKRGYTSSEGNRRN